MSASHGTARSTTTWILAELWRRQPVLGGMGWASLGVLLVALAAMAFDLRMINGVSVWTKPAKFAASFVVWYWSLAWAWGVLAPAARQSWTARLVLWGTVAAGAFELGWITLRGALGLPSHFASDLIGAIMYPLMGVGAVTLVALAAMLGVLVLRRGNPALPQPWRLAVGLGLVIGGVTGGITGATISALDGPIIAATLSDATAWPPFYWSRQGGDLRIAHFLGAHAIQAMPALALLWPGANTIAIVVGALAWTGLTIGAFAAALAGVPLMP